MAVFTTVPDSVLEPGDPIRSVDIIAIKDNPIAIAEGATGAPRVQDAALNATVTTAGKTWVSNRIAAQAHQDIGSMTIAWNTTTSDVASNGNIAGGSLRFASTNQHSMFTTVEASSTSAAPSFPTAGTLSLSGTWKNMGGFSRSRQVTESVVDSGYSQITTFTSAFFPSFWLRIA